MLRAFFSLSIRTRRITLHLNVLNDPSNAIALMYQADQNIP